MSGFQWRGRNARGQLVNGHVEADSSDAVAEQLMRLDITPIEIQEAEAGSQSAGNSLRTRLGLDRPGVNDLILFTRQMYTLTKAGVPLIRGLNNVAESTRNPVLRQAIEDLVDALESGRELADGLAQNPRVFPNMFVSIVRVGEGSGNLEQSFLQLNGYLELERDFRARLKQALRYPAMVIVAMVIAVAILMVWVIPVFANFFARHDAELPLPTRIIVATSEFTSEWWWLVLLAIGALLFAFRYWIGTENGRYRWDRIKLRLPVIGKILFEGTMARFARSFSMTYRSGVPLIQGLTLVSKAVENEYIGQAVNDMRTGIERGESLSRTAAATGLFSSLVLQMISIGEETGDVDTMLTETAEYYEREVDYDLDNLSALIEPILLVFLAVLVLIMALGVFLPMWDVGRAALG
ncbi:type II secretion system F family protein [Wenzhouxiangella sp. AB-CW3]|uniref:type II secretion system F family protein n=1 Tax=Wenzhouxiangella sp. AB-CW3 TaxID=2771012 RepID=UPI00168A815B|nr:type II secretion system F family protein [Wenzhouxiangella sp. AB-CW3]QOC23834.1 type II secretion system F family protein [Wenzhouxiangella sp. AB-CW3]